MKKALSFILALCLLCAVCMPVSAAKIDEMTDVPSGQWYFDAVSYCLDKGHMNGVGGGKFNPNGSVTRAQMAQVLYNKEGKQEVGTSPFTDVKDNAWYGKAVTWCAQEGIVTGTGKGQFSPNKQVIRQDICVMVYRYVTQYLGLEAEYTPYETMCATFTDMVQRKPDGSKNYAEDALCWANKMGFMSGTSRTTLAPDKTCTRAQLAQFIRNLDVKVLHKDVTPEEPTVCEHGNNPDTCEICHPKEPEVSGIYNPNPPAENYVASEY